MEAKCTHRHLAPVLIWREGSEGGEWGRKEDMLKRRDKLRRSRGERHGASDRETDTKRDFVEKKDKNGAGKR